MLSLGFFVGLNAAALAYARNHYGTSGIVSRYMDLQSLGALVNFGCLLVLLKDDGNEVPYLRPSLLRVLTCLWVIMAGCGLARLTTDGIASGLPFAKSCSDRETLAVAAFVRHPDRAAFLRKDPFELQCQEPADAVALLEDPKVIEILPWQVRPPIVLEANMASPAVHKVQSAEDDGKIGWMLEPRSVGPPVHFRSRPIASHLPFVRFPETTGIGGGSFIALVEEGTGATIVLDQGPPAAPGPLEWQPLTARAPKGPFRVEAILAPGTAQPLAFSLPREVGALSTWVDPLLNSAIGFLFAGAGLWLGAISWWRPDAASARNLDMNSAVATASKRL